MTTFILILIGSVIVLSVAAIIMAIDIILHKR